MGPLKKLVAGVKRVVVMEMSGWLYAIVAGVVFLTTFAAAVTVLGEDPGTTVGGVSGVVFAVLAIYVLTKRLPYPKGHQ